MSPGARLGFRTSGLRNLPLERALGIIAEAGYPLVEFCMEHPGAGSYRGGMHGLVPSAVSYHGKRDPAPVRMRRIAEALERAWEMNATVVVLGSPRTGSMSWEGFLDECTETLHRLPPGVRPAWEPEPGTVLEDMERFGALVDHLGPEPGLNLDFGHALLEGLPPDEALEASRGRTLHTHLEDLPRGEHVHLLPGDGVFPWSALTPALKRYGYHGPLVLDLFHLPADPEPFIRRARYRALELLGVL